MVALGWQQLSEEPWKRLSKELWVGGRVVFSLCGENSWMLMCNVALFRWSMPRHECSLAASWRLTVWCRRRLQEWLCYSMSQRYVNIGLFLYHWQTHSCTMRNSFHTTKAHSCTTSYNSAPCSQWRSCWVATWTREQLSISWRQPSARSLAPWVL